VGQFVRAADEALKAGGEAAEQRVRTRVAAI